jgi:hypothetical protein
LGAKLKNGTRQGAQAGLKGVRRKIGGVGKNREGLFLCKTWSASQRQTSKGKLGGTRIFAVFTAMPN